MATIREYAEDLMRFEQAAQLRENSRFTPDWVETLMDKYRVPAMHQWLQNNKVSQRMGYGNSLMPPSWYQRVDIDIVEGEQDNQWCFLKFELPTDPIRFNDGTDGFTFVGEDVLGRTFRKIKTPSYASDLIKAGRLKATKEIAYVYDGQYLRLYGNKLLETITLDCIFEYPLRVPGFNPDEDDYPISPDLLPLILNLIRIDLHYMGNKPQDLNLNRNDTA